MLDRIQNLLAYIAGQDEMMYDMGDPVSLDEYLLSIIGDRLDSYLLPSGGTDGQVLKIVDGVPTWSNP